MAKEKPSVYWTFSKNTNVHKPSLNFFPYRSLTKTWRILSFADLKKKKKNAKHSKTLRAPKHVPVVYPCKFGKNLHTSSGNTMQTKQSHANSMLMATQSIPKTTGLFGACCVCGWGLGMEVGISSTGFYTPPCLFGPYLNCGKYIWVINPYPAD